MKSTNIQKLRDFYVVDGKLLYLSDEFIGYNPIISKGLKYKKVPDRGTTVARYKLLLNGSNLSAKLTKFLDYGPVRGFRRIEVAKNKFPLLLHEAGSMGHGTNYWRGKEYAFDGQLVCLVKNGYAFRDWKTGAIFNNLEPESEYILYFENVTKPVTHRKKVPDGRSLSFSKRYGEHEIMPLIQTIWTGSIHTDSKVLKIEKTGVPYCWWTYYDKDTGNLYSRSNYKNPVALQEYRFT